MNLVRYSFLLGAMRREGGREDDDFFACRRPPDGDVTARRVPAGSFGSVTSREDPSITLSKESTINPTKDKATEPDWTKDRSHFCTKS
jgi:hypothetical protein